MLSYVKRSKIKISFIIVYSVDRFSRSGANAMYIASELKKEGVMVQAVTQPADTSTASGSLQQNIQFIFSQYDNEVKREKVIAGMREKMLHGYWPTMAPTGYDHHRINGEQKIVVNEKGKILRKLFIWKAEEDVSIVELSLRSKALGFYIPEKRLSKLLKNPFYCGILSHSLLDGQVIEGKHEKMISQEVFLKINELQNKNHQHYKHVKESEPHPLRRFIRCADCGSGFAGYEVKKKRIHYYKCSKKGCRCNKSAKHMHHLFGELLNDYTLDPQLLPFLQEQLTETYESYNETDMQLGMGIKSEVTALTKKIETVEEGNALKEIEKDVYLRLKTKYKDEKLKLEKKLQEMDSEISNLEECLEFCLNFSSNLHSVWELSNYAMKQKVQNAVFPEGILYDRQIDGFRTSDVNLIFQLNHYFSENLEANKKGVKSFKSFSPLSVIPLGFEPRTPTLKV